MSKRGKKAKRANGKRAKRAKASSAPKRDPRVELRSAVRSAASASFCPHCHGPMHEGDSEEPLAALEPDAVVFFDRDVVEPGIVADLCGPRFRITNRQLLAHFGSPAGTRYVVFTFNKEAKSWKSIIDTDVSKEYPIASRHMRHAHGVVDNDL